MNILANVLIVLALLASVALILIVVVQKSKGGGLAASFASANNIMGVRKSTDMLEKMTWWFFGALAVLCIVVSLIMARGGVDTNELQNTIENRAAEAPAVGLPNFATPNDDTNTVATPATTTEEPVAAPQQDASAEPQTEATNN